MASKQLFRAARGTRDLFGPKLQAIRHFEGVFSSTVQARGYEEIEMPILERKMIFLRGLGADTDVVAKEMFDVAGTEGDPLVLRPEGTACAMRAHLAMGGSPGLRRSWYTGPMFRHERPQAGRFRQFRQAGIEAIGADSMELDVESVWLCWKVIQRTLESAGQQSLAAALTVRLNSLGKGSERDEYSLALREYFAQCSTLSVASASRLATGGDMLGILDSKHPEDIAACAGAPPISTCWGAETQQRFEDTVSALTDLQVPIQTDATLARGLDYYNGLCWELQADQPAVGPSHSASARALTLAGGGRYDGLAQSMGHKQQVPAVGWAAGVDRVAALLEEANCLPVAQATRWAVIAVSSSEQAGRLARKAATELSQLETGSGHCVTVSLDPVVRKPGKALKTSTAAQAHFVVLVGDAEAAQGAVTVRNMSSRTQEAKSLQELLRQVSQGDMYVHDGR